MNPPTIRELAEADRWQTLAAAEERPAFREACEGIAVRLRTGWTAPEAEQRTKIPARDLFAKMRLEIEQALPPTHNGSVPAGQPSRACVRPGYSIDTP